MKNKVHDTNDLEYYAFLKKKLSMLAAILNLHKSRCCVQHLTNYKIYWQQYGLYIESCGGRDI